MIYYRCQCGKSVAYGSIAPSDCHGCRDCNTTLTTSPDFHKSVPPHRIRAFPVKADTPATLSRCVLCLDTLVTIKKRGEPFEEDA